MSETPTSETPAAAPASPSIIGPEPSKVRRTRADLQARAAASAQYRKRQKEKGIPTNPEIDAAISTLFLRVLSKKGLHLRPEAIASVPVNVMRTGEWTDTDDNVLDAIKARIDKHVAKRSPSAASPPEKPVEPVG